MQGRDLRVGCGGQVHAGDKLGGRRGESTRRWGVGGGRWAGASPGAQDLQEGDSCTGASEGCKEVCRAGRPRGASKGAGSTVVPGVMVVTEVHEFSELHKLLYDYLHFLELDMTAQLEYTRHLRQHTFTVGGTAID
jgi:hypothetical protein